MITEDLRLREALPRDSPHILVWDNLNEFELRQLAYREDAEWVSYRTDLLARVSPQKTHYLSLHLWLDRELDSIKTICAETSKPLVILQDLDRLITYLSIQGTDFLSPFWQKLFTTRHLNSILWILLPSSLVPNNWSENRIQRI